jgi:hypothetical protein
MSFGKSRFNKAFEYELIRYCGKLHTTIVGGAGKLFQHFIRTSDCKSIISYCQRRLFTGLMYEKLGMTFLHSSPPNYTWVNSNNDIKTRYQTQRHKLNDTNTKTEREIMKARGYYQIYDCGQLVYGWYK